MNGKLPAAAETAKRTKTLLNVSWQPTDLVLMEALRPYKARSRGRRFKELALLGAELERLGFRLQESADGYRLMLPAGAELSGSLPLVAVRANAPGDRSGSPQADAVSNAPRQPDVAAASVAPAPVPLPPEPVLPAPAPVVMDHDTAAFAEAFIM